MREAIVYQFHYNLANITSRSARRQPPTSPKKKNKKTFVAPSLQNKTSPLPYVPFWFSPRVSLETASSLFIHTYTFCLVPLVPRALGLASPSVAVCAPFRSFHHHHHHPLSCRCSLSISTPLTHHSQHLFSGGWDTLMCIYTKKRRRVVKQRPSACRGERSRLEAAPALLCVTKLPSPPS
jgi:hypothetical protein